MKLPQKMSLCLIALELLKALFSLEDVKYGAETVSTHAGYATSQSRNDFERGRAFYPKQTKYDGLLLFTTYCELHSLIILGNHDKFHRTSSDRAQFVLFEELLKIDWKHQALATEVKIKSFGFH